MNLVMCSVWLCCFNILQIQLRRTACLRSTEIVMFVSSGPSTTCLLHAWNHDCMQDKTECSFCQMLSSLFLVSQQCVWALKLTRCLTNNMHCVLTSLTLTQRREQTLKNPSKDLMFVIFPWTSSLITSPATHHLWLLTPLNISACDQDHCLWTKPMANALNVQAYLSNWCTDLETQFACRLRRSFVRSVKCVFLPHANALTFRGGLHTWWGDVINMADCTLWSIWWRLSRHSGVSFKRKVLILALTAVLDLSVSKFSLSSVWIAMATAMCVGQIHWII